MMAHNLNLVIDLMAFVIKSLVVVEICRPHLHHDRLVYGAALVENQEDTAFNPWAPFALTLRQECAELFVGGVLEDCYVVVGFARAGLKLRRGIVAGWCSWTRCFALSVRKLEFAHKLATGRLLEWEIKD